VAVVLAAEGYPGSPRKGDAISGVAEAESLGVSVLHAGTTIGPDGLSTSGGRILAVTATGADLAAARDLVYRGVDAIHFRGAQYRTDIAEAASSG
jgi:phosphoribosylamine--glycine ligase